MVNSADILNARILIVDVLEANVRLLEGMLRALKAGAEDFVSKPFEMAEVLARFHNMLEVRLLHLETKKLYDRVGAEEKFCRAGPGRSRLFPRGAAGIEIHTPLPQSQPH